jgi:predicted ATP-grasp superfamily ATP-dependent carboligase
VGQALFQGMGLRGLASAEFKKDERDGEYKLIECTPRFTMSNELVRRSGIDLALVAYNRLVGLPLPPVATFRDNLRLWFPRDDMRALRAYRRAGLLSTTQWLRTLARPPHLPTFSWRDPLPSLAGAKTRWRAALARSPNPTPGERSAHGARGGPAEVAEPSSRS